MVKNEDFFDPSDFESIRLLITLENIALGQRLEKRNDISIVEINGTAVTMTFPLRLCFQGNHVILEFTHYTEINQTQKLVLVATGKVLSVDNDEGSTQQKAVIKLLQYDKVSWENFLLMFTERQNEIMKFFEMGKK